MFVIVFGCGIGKEDYNFEKFCYYCIIIMIDVDVDGVYIWMLLFMFLYCQMLDMIECGYVYIVQLLFYKIKVGKDEWYLKDDVEFNVYMLWLVL